MVPDRVVARPRPIELITGEALACRTDLGRSELVEGRIVMLSPTRLRHGTTENLFGEVLRRFVREQNAGVVAVGEVGIYTRRDPDTVRGADVLFMSNGRLARLGEAAYLDVAPELVVEVLSPDDLWSRVRKKLREYFDIGVQLVWVADPEDRTVHVFRSPTEVQVLAEGDVLTGGDVLPGFSAPVATLFA